jgi:hypothetical protein
MAKYEVRFDASMVVTMDTNHTDIERITRNARFFAENMILPSGGIAVSVEVGLMELDEVINLETKEILYSQ